MRALFRIKGGRWSAVVRKVEPGTFGDPELDVQVKVFCGRVEIMCFGFCPEQNRTADTSNGPTVLDYVDLFEFSLSDVDVEDLLYLMCVADCLCQRLHDGGSVEGWCAAQGLRPLREAKGRRRRNRRSALLIKAKGRTFRLPARRSPGEGRPLRGGLYR